MKFSYEMREWKWKVKIAKSLINVLDNFDTNICVSWNFNVKLFALCMMEKNESKEVLLECKAVCVYAILDWRPYFYLKH